VPTAQLPPMLWSAVSAMNAIDAYYESELRLVRPAGLIAPGLVADPNDTDTDTVALRSTNTKNRRRRASGPCPSSHCQRHDTGEPPLEPGRKPDRGQLRVKIHRYTNATPTAALPSRADVPTIPPYGEFVPLTDIVSRLRTTAIAPVLVTEELDGMRSSSWPVEGGFLDLHNRQGAMMRQN